MGFLDIFKPKEEQDRIILKDFILKYFDSKSPDKFNWVQGVDIKEITVVKGNIGRSEVTIRTNTAIDNWRFAVTQFSTILISKTPYRVVSHGFNDYILEFSVVKKQ